MTIAISISLSSTPKNRRKTSAFAWKRSIAVRDAAEFHLLPHLWFRNTWSWTDPPSGEPTIQPGTGRSST